MRISESDLRSVINEVISEALGNEDLEKHSREDVDDELAMAMKCWSKMSSDAIFRMCKEVMEFNSDNAMNCLDLIACCCVSDKKDLNSCYECLCKICECKGCKMICMRHCGLGN